MSTLSISVLVIPLSTNSSKKRPCTSTEQCRKSTLGWSSVFQLTQRVATSGGEVYLQAVCGYSPQCPLFARSFPVLNAFVDVAHNTAKKCRNGYADQKGNPAALLWCTENKAQPPPTPIPTQSPASLLASGHEGYYSLSSYRAIITICVHSFHCHIF